MDDNKRKKDHKDSGKQSSYSSYKDTARSYREHQYYEKDSYHSKSNKTLHHSSHSEYKDDSRSRQTYQSHGESPHGSGNDYHGKYSSHDDSTNLREDRYHKKDKSHSSNDKISQQKLSPDYEFNWEEHKYYLNRIFFHKDSCIQSKTHGETDFWNFLKKYVTFQQKKAHSNQSANQQKKSGNKSSYSSQNKLNFELTLKPDSTAMADMHGRKAEKYLTEERLSQFKNIISHYVDFVQKQKFNKLKKIKESQRNLPIYQYKEQIVEAVKSNQVVVVAGDTGCGKSTQVPQYLVAAGFEHIACTQPRRIACISLSRRVSFETLNEYGSEVAYQVRFEKSKTKSTKVLFLTEGLLLRQIGSDPLLSQYSVIVIDEVHERHIHTDFLLGVVKCILKQKPDLKVVLMSATINITLFSNYFDGAPVLSVPGRLYPIQLQYIPVSVEEMGSKTEKLDPSPYLRVLQTIDHKYPQSERGDVLMFLSGMTEIMTVVDAAKQYASKNKRWIILPLHSALSIKEQDQVFDFPPDGVRKCIVSTNIAETSVTIDGVRFVVDSGKVKEMSFDTTYKLQKLQEFCISKASSEQRKGRAGRTGPGVCYRLYAESDYKEYQEYSTPEIHRVPLDSLVLQMAALGLPDARKFPFIEPPDAVAIENAILTLKEQNALNEKEQLTAIGNMLAQLPVDLVIGKMLIMASLFHMIDPALIICSALSVQSPFTMRAQKDYDAVTARQDIQSDHGDPLTLLNAYDEWMQVKSEGRNSNKWCKRRGLEEQRFYEMSKLIKQFRELLGEYGLLERKEKGVEYKSREERKKLSNDRKRLRELRHEQRSQGKKRKVLRLEDDDWEIDQGLVSDDGEVDTGDIDTNIKDLEFKLSHDLSENQSNSSRNFTLKEINILKVILCSGLYPQFAIADEHNSFKADTEQLFHTKNKGFVLLHPTSVFTADPEVLQAKVIKENENSTKKEDRLKGPISNGHQLLTFVTLLETNKPYLTGTMRVPALQTLLLFSSAIDTSLDSMRIVCDSWLEVCVTGTTDEAEDLISNVVRLRTAWEYLMDMKLAAHQQQRSVEGNMQGDKLALKVKYLQKEMSQKLAAFLLCDVNYTLRRVLAAESAKMYIGPVDCPQDLLVSDLHESDWKPHPIKGGVEITPYLVLNCLIQTETSVLGEYTTCLQKHWTCNKCKESFIVSLAGRLHHEQVCNQKSQQDRLSKAVLSAVIDDETLKPAKITKAYHCPICDEQLQLTTAEILKHRKQCKSEQCDSKE